MHSNDDQGRVVNFMNPGAGVLVLGHGHISYIGEMHYFFKKSSSLVLGIDQANYIVMMTNEESTKIVNFMTPGKGFMFKGVVILV